MSQTLEPRIESSFLYTREDGSQDAIHDTSKEFFIARHMARKGLDPTHFISYGVNFDNVIIFYCGMVENPDRILSGISHNGMLAIACYKEVKYKEKICQETKIKIGKGLISDYGERNNTQALNELLSFDELLVDQLRLFEDIYGKKEGKIKLASGYKDIGQYTKSLELLSQLNEEYPNDCNILNHMGLVYNEMGEFEKAKEFFQRAISTNSDFAKSIDELRSISPSLEELLASKNRRCKDASYVDSFACLGLIYKNQSKPLEGFPYLKMAIKLNPQQPYNWSTLGELYRMIGQLDNAERCYKRSVEIGRFHKWGYNSLANLKLQKGNTKAAENYVDKALEIDPNFVNALETLRLIKQEKNKT